MENIEHFIKEKIRFLHELDKTYDDINPTYIRNERCVDTLADFTIQNEVLDGIFYPFLSAIQIVYKAISSKIERFNLPCLGEPPLDIKDRMSPPVKPDVPRFVKYLEELFINVVGDSGIIGYMISKYTEDIIRINSRVPGKYMVCFNILDGKGSLKDHLPAGSIYGLYKLNSEGDLDLNDLTGNSIVNAGYVIYGTCTLMILAFSNHQGVHGFYLDQSLGEFTLNEPFKNINKRGTNISVNEGITIGWDEATKIFIHRKKDPRFGPPSQSFYTGTFSADVTRILKGGGIYLYPSNIKHPEGKMALLYDCNPVGYVIRQAGGYATDGWTSILDVVPNNIHQKVPFFGGSIEDVISLMELKSVYKAKTFK